MKAVCVRECTIPGRGLVEAGTVVDVVDRSAPWLKHFTVSGGWPAPAEAVVAAPPEPRNANQPAEQPAPAKAGRGRGGKRKG